MSVEPERDAGGAAHADAAGDAELKPEAELTADFIQRGRELAMAAGGEAALALHTALAARRARRPAGGDRPAGDRLGVGNSVAIFVIVYAVGFAVTLWALGLGSDLVDVVLGVPPGRA